MTEFQTAFGRGPQLALSTTFRCTQTICDVARAFVSKNPNQFDKRMQSAQGAMGAPVRVIQTNDTAAAVRSYLNELSQTVARDASIGGPQTVTVDVLGRYRFERSVMPSQWPSNLHLTFRTVHASKGLEADYVVVPGLTTGTYGFPSTIADDSVLALAMPAPEDFAHAEERRLLYVALTRARREVLLITSPRRMSPFAAELIKYPSVAVVDDDGTRVEICPQCGKGTLVERKGRFGVFFGCSAFPACDYTRNIEEPMKAHAPRSRPRH
jgi:DNA helicase-4